MKERERQEMDKFDTECETVYGILKSKFEIEMELPEIVAGIRWSTRPTKVPEVDNSQPGCDWPELHKAHEQIP
jgi:hypothetical protein